MRDARDSSSVAAFFLWDARWYEKNFNVLVGLIFLTGAALLMASAFTGENSDVIVGDGIGHFEYARALMVDGRLPRRHIAYPCGVSMIGILGYAPSIWVSRAFGWLDEPRAAQGFALFNQLAFCLPIIALSLVGIFANAKMLDVLKLPPDISRLSIVIWLIGTNIPYYFFKEPALSESATYSTVSIYYWLLLRQYYCPRNSLRGWVLAGLALGFAGIVRQQNILHGFALALLAAAAPDLQWRSRPATSLLAWLRRLAPAALAAAAVFIIPYFAWAGAEGNLRLYSYSGQGFNFLHPKFFQILFAFRYHGLFVWTPIFALAVLGWFPFLSARRGLLLPLLIPVFLQYYLLATWWASSFGASVGHRGFFTILPLLLPGLPALLESARRRNRDRPLIALLLLLAIANLLLLLLISAGKILV